MTVPSIKFWHKGGTPLPAAVAASMEPILRYFNYHDAHPVGLMMALMEKFGVSWFEWEPETLRAEIIESFNSTGISVHNWQKIQAIRSLVLSVGFWSEWHIFEKLIQSLNNNVPRFDISQRCSPAQLMSGVDIANTVRKEEFGDEIARYVAACLLDEGLVYAPPPIDFAQTVLSKPMYRCQDCGTVETDDLDGRCDSCTGRFRGTRPLNFKPLESVGPDVGKNIKRFLARDHRPVEKRFDQLKLKDQNEVDFDPNNNVDVQTIKLLVAHNYMLKRRREQVEQLEELKSWVTR